MDFSKIESDEFRSNFCEFRVRDLFMKLRDIFEPMASQKKLFFNMSLSERVPDIIYQDE